MSEMYINYKIHSNSICHSFDFKCGEQTYYLLTSGSDSTGNALGFGAALLFAAVFGENLVIMECSSIWGDYHLVSCTMY